MKKFLTSFLLCLSITGFAQQVMLSPEAEVSIITCGPSADEVYTAFGHSAIRVLDPAHQIDYVYNYGVFDFDQPYFYLNYTRGLLLFKLGVYNYPDFVNTYAYYNRWVKEQVLDLSAPQKQAVFDYLQWNALPENETYRYDYYYNNCATKVRDVFAEVLKDSMRFEADYMEGGLTLRQLTGLYLNEQPWGDLGIDICLGLPLDKRASTYEYMFLPDYVLSGFDHTTVQRNGVWVPIVRQKITVFANTPTPAQAAPVHPWVIFGGILFIAGAISLFDGLRKKLSLWFDVILFGTFGVIGLLLLTLWMATDHQAASNNFNLLWALPTHLSIIGAGIKRWRRQLRIYFRIVGGFEILVLLCWYWLPQEMNPFLLPLVGALAIRALLISVLLPVPQDQR